MDREQLLQRIRHTGLWKLTGPPEHWLTTLNTFYWGLTTDHEATWEGLQPGSCCVLHGTHTEYLSSRPQLPTGIIGIGVIAGTDTKETLEWIGELQENRNGWPLLIRFREIWWFGPTSQIENEPIREKLDRGEARLIADLGRLTGRAVTFGEMKRAGYQIPAQGSIKRLSSAGVERLLPLLEDRLKEPTLSPQEIGPILGDLELDLGLIGIDSSDFTLLLADQLHGTTYHKFAGSKVSVPANPAVRPSAEVLDKHRSDAGL